MEKEEAILNHLKQRGVDLRIREDDTEANIMFRHMISEQPNIYIDSVATLSPTGSYNFLSLEYTHVCGRELNDGVLYVPRTGVTLLVSSVEKTEGGNNVVVYYAGEPKEVVREGDIISRR